MEVVQWGVFLVCASIAIYVLLLNYYCVYENLRLKRSGADKRVSLIPLACPAFALVATIFSPLALAKSGIGLFGVAFVLDVGTTGILIMALVSGVKYLIGCVST